GESEYPSGIKKIAHATRVARTVAWMGGSADLVAAALLSGLNKKEREELVNNRDFGPNAGSRLKAHIDALEELNRDVFRLGKPDSTIRPFFQATDEVNYFQQRLARVAEEHRYIKGKNILSVRISDLLRLHLSSMLQEVSIVTRNTRREDLKSVYDQVQMREAIIAERVGLRRVVNKLLHDSFRAAYPKEYEAVVRAHRERVGMTRLQTDQFIKMQVDKLKHELKERHSLGDDEFEVIGDEKKYQSSREKYLDPNQGMRNKNRPEGEFDFSETYDLVRFMVIFKGPKAAENLTRLRSALGSVLGARHPERKTRHFSKDGRVQWQRENLQIDNPWKKGEKVDTELQLITESLHQETYLRGRFGKGRLPHSLMKLKRATRNYLTRLDYSPEKISLMVRHFFFQPDPELDQTSLNKSLKNVTEAIAHSIYVKAPIQSDKALADRSAFWSFRLPKGAIALDALLHPLVDLEPREYDVYRLRLEPVGKGNREPRYQEEKKLELYEEVRPGDLIYFKKREERLPQHHFDGWLGQVKSARARVWLNPDRDNQNLLSKEAEMGKKMLQARFGADNWPDKLKEIVSPLCLWLGLKSEKELYVGLAAKDHNNEPLIDFGMIERWYTQRYIEANYRIEADNVISIKMDENHLFALSDVTSFAAGFNLRIVKTELKTDENGGMNLRLEFSRENSSREILEDYAAKLLRCIHRERGSREPTDFGRERKIVLYLNSRVGTLHQLSTLMAQEGLEIVNLHAEEDPEIDVDGEKYDLVELTTRGPDSYREETEELSAEEISNKIARMLRDAKLKVGQPAEKFSLTADVDVSLVK
ncbi:MAG: hypothetical protein D6719_07170, partial [Candidatus Dadabacteria bacterium]